MADPMLQAESPIKHTSGGEMPDPSVVSELTRRFRAALPVLGEKTRGLKVPLPLVLGVLVLFGGLLVRRSIRR